jgi:predicted  nucleic acid-binding Zn-ribbon protein
MAPRKRNPPRTTLATLQEQVDDLIEQMANANETILDLQEQITELNQRVTTAEDESLSRQTRLQETEDRLRYLRFAGGIDHDI